MGEGCNYELTSYPSITSFKQLWNLIIALTSFGTLPCLTLLPIVKDHLVDTNNRFNGIFPSFSLLHSKLSSDLRIIDNFSDQFSFNLCNKEKNDKIHLQQLDNMVIESSDFLSTAIIVMDASIKNDIATSISYMHTFNSPLIKTLYHAIFVTSTEAELFTIRYSINQASNREDISKIIIITDFIHVAKKIFDLSPHPYQIHAVAILNKLHKFFVRNQNNLIEFWECPSRLFIKQSIKTQRPLILH